MSENVEDLKKAGAAALSKLRQTREVKSIQTAAERQEPRPEDADSIRAQKKARLTQVLARGILNEKLRVIYEECVPDGRFGKFVLAREEDIILYKNLGFDFIYTEKAKGLHGTADGKVRVGDVVLMTIDAEDREILKEVRQDRIRSNLMIGRKEYVEKASEELDRGGAVPFNEGSIEIKTGGN